MKLLADENVEASITNWLREIGHDVVYVPEMGPGVEDTEVLQVATGGGRIVVTRDLDFGLLVCFQRLAAQGVILLRTRAATSEEHLGRLQEVWSDIEANLEGNITVVTNTKVRARPLPTSRL